MYRIAICDDTPSDADFLCRSIDDVVGAGGAVTELFPDADALLARCRAVAFDIVFMDVMLGGKNGIDAAQRLHAAAPGTQIVFVSRSCDFLYDSYRVPHVWYVQKPDIAALLPQVLARAKEALQMRDCGRIAVRTRARTVFLPCADVLYIEQCSRKARIITKNGVLEEYARISEILPALADTSFVQCHKSFLVNMDEAVSCTRSEVTLRSGEVVPVSRAYYANLQEYLVQRARAFPSEREGP